MKCIISIKLYLFLCLLLNFLSVRAQIHAIKSIDPNHIGFKDLNFLKQELTGRSVVMLGEPSHREGNVFDAKIRIIKFLHEEMGFNVIAFESGFFEVEQAQLKIDGGGDVMEALDSALFPIWTRSEQFRPLMEYINRQKNSLKVMGFDPQITKQGASGFISAFKKYVVDKGLRYSMNDMLFSEVLESLSEGVFPDGVTFSAFQTEIRKATEMLKKLPASDSRSTDFWFQNLKSLELLATDYYTNRPGEKRAEDFKASDSNPRDSQMADHLSYYIRHHPNEKIICWGASLHFAAQSATLENDELKTYKPMGQSVRAVIGNNRVYTLATISAGGSYASWFDKEPTAVPQAATGSLEAMFAGNNQGDYQFIDSEMLKRMGVKESNMFDYTALRGDWSKVVDGILYFKAYTPVLPALLNNTNQLIRQDNGQQQNSAQAMPNGKSLWRINKTGSLVIDLDDVVVRPSDGNAVQIVKKAFESLERHLNQNTYTMGFYVDTQVANLDSTTYHLEYTGIIL